MQRVGDGLGFLLLHSPASSNIQGRDLALDLVELADPASVTPLANRALQPE